MLLSKVTVFLSPFLLNPSIDESKFVRPLEGSGSFRLFGGGGGGGPAGGGGGGVGDANPFIGGAGGGLVVVGVIGILVTLVCRLITFSVGVGGAT